MTLPAPDVAAAICAACDQARTRHTPVILSHSLQLDPVEDTLPFLRGGNEAHAFFWQRPADGVVIAARGTILELCESGPDRFSALADRGAALRAAAVQTSPGGALLFVGGFAFGDTPPGGSWVGFPAARLVVPRACIVQRGVAATLTCNRLIEPQDRPADVEHALSAEIAGLRAARIHEAAPAPADGAPYSTIPFPAVPAWREAVAALVGEIRGGQLEKAVLARSCVVRAAADFDPEGVVRRLRRAYPTCTTFWMVSPAGDFIGATPEPLVQMEGGAVRTAAIAGSAARGTTVAADRALADGLRGSGKERHEHALVVRAIATALAPACTTLHVAETPEILRLATVQHLITPIHGTLSNGQRVLDLVARLHPTPAVAGSPRGAALAAIARHERIGRGWYAGAVGWTDGAGAGEFAVALRCALLRGDRAELFAGAGIVAGSDPDAEVAETRLKFQPLLSALMEL